MLIMASLIEKRPVWMANVKSGVGLYEPAETENAPAN